LNAGWVNGKGQYAVAIYFIHTLPLWYMH
jgi:hypothetical protein